MKLDVMELSVSVGSHPKVWGGETYLWERTYRRTLPSVWGCSLERTFSLVLWYDADPISQKLIRSVAVHDPHTLIARLASEDSKMSRIGNVIWSEEYVSLLGPMSSRSFSYVRVKYTSTIALRTPFRHNGQHKLPTPP